MIAKLTGAMVKKYVCKACHSACTRKIKYVCDQTCSDCMASLTCAFSSFRIPCPNTKGILEVPNVTTNTNRVINRSVPCANESVVAQRVDGS